MRWRLVDLARWLHEKFAVSLDETTVNCELKKLGYVKLTAWPRHHAQRHGGLQKGGFVFYNSGTAAITGSACTRYATTANLVTKQNIEAGLGGSFIIAVDYALGKVVTSNRDALDQPDADAGRPFRRRVVDDIVHCCTMSPIKTSLGGFMSLVGKPGWMGYRRIAAARSVVPCSDA